MRIKGLDPSATVAYQHSGKLHEIVNPGVSFELFDPSNPQNLTLDELTDAIAETVQIGKPIVSTEYEGDLRRFVKHEVFPDKIIEEKRSAHGVSFGRFVLRQSGLHVPRERRNKLSVAMKPFTSAEHAARECAGYIKLALSGIETFSPVGIFPALESDNLVVVTQKRNDLVSLDRDVWAEGMQVQSERDVQTLERNTQTVTEISQLLAYLHGLGIFHPDGQIKNWAVDQIGTIGVIDTENLTQLPLHHQDTADMATSDIDKLLKSLVNNQRENKIYGVGLLHGLNDAILHGYVQTNIIEPYIDVIMTLNLNGSIDDMQAEILIDGISEHSKREGISWPNCLNTDHHTE